GACYAAWTAIPFFFQAEDGIRALYVTGVQTCALPIYTRALAALLLLLAAPVVPAQGASGDSGNAGKPSRAAALTAHDAEARALRSEERRVGKECRSRGASCQQQNQELS